MVISMRGYVSKMIEKVETEKGIFREAVNKGIIKMKPLSSNDFVYLITSGENPDARVIVAVEDCSNDVCAKISTEVVKLIYHLVDLIFIKKTPPSGEPVTLASLRSKYDTYIDALAHIKRKYKIIPVFYFSLSPGVKSVRSGFSIFLLKVDDTRKLREKLKTPLGDEVYVPKIYDDVLVTYKVDTYLFRDSIQKEYVLSTKADLVNLYKLMKEFGRDAWSGVVDARKLLERVMIDVGGKVQSVLLPRSGNYLVPALLVAQGSYLPESLLYPSNRLVERGVQEGGLIGLYFVLEYRGVKAKSYKVLNLKNKSVKIDEKSYNLELEPLEKIIGKLALGTASTLSYALKGV